MPTFLPSLSYNVIGNLTLRQNSCRSDCKESSNQRIAGMSTSLFDSCNGQASIETSKTCYDQGEAVAVTFDVVEEESKDWIGIFNKNESNDDLFDYEAWVWTCGDRSCETSQASGTVEFGSTLSRGQYKAVLIRYSDPPYEGLAVSESFEIRESCGSDAERNDDDNLIDDDATISAASNEEIFNALASARSDIEALFVNNIELPAKAIRLIFHDCVGGCDGCVDLDNADNTGLDIPINALDNIVRTYASPETGLSRADIWALAAMVGAEISQETTDLSFSLDWWGRVDCENSGQECIGSEGETVECSATKGSHRELPGIHQRTSDLFAFFANEFGFNQRETVAIMGAHTLGTLSKENSGIDGPNGWVIQNRVLDNGYYQELIGGDSPDDSIDVVVNDAPEWNRAIEKTDGTKFPSEQRIWVGLPSGTKIVMLNADIAIVRNFNSENFDRSIGRASCTFEESTSDADTPVCPFADGAIQIAQEFSHDNFGWITEFRDVLGKMITNGYSRNQCSDIVCKLD